MARPGACRFITVEANREYLFAKLPNAQELSDFLAAMALFATSVLDVGFDRAAGKDIAGLKQLKLEMAKLLESKYGDHTVRKWSAMNVRFHQSHMCIDCNFN